VIVVNSDGTMLFGECSFTKGCSWGYLYLAMAFCGYFELHILVRTLSASWDSRYEMGSFLLEFEGGLIIGKWHHILPTPQPNAALKDWAVAGPMFSGRLG
jgi:hypothetical protein